MIFFQLIFTIIVVFVGLGEGVIAGFPRFPSEWSLRPLFSLNASFKLPDWLLSVCFFNLALTSCEVKNQDGRFLVGLLSATVGVTCTLWVLSMLGKVFGVATLLLGLFEILLGRNIIVIDTNQPTT